MTETQSSQAAAARKIRRTPGAKQAEDKREEKLGLFESLDEFDLEKLCDVFNKEKGRRFNCTRLKEILKDVAKVTIDDDQEFDITFMKMNSKRDGFVTWDEFISYLILSYQQKEIKPEFETLENPIPTVPTIIKSRHRYTVNRIIYCPTVRPDRSISWHDGSLMTCSRDGTINYWSLDLSFERSVKSSCPNLRVQQTWVTDMVALPDVSVICTSSTERDLRFYDTSARKFELRIIFTSIEHPINTMNYWFSENPNKESVLVLGDMRGNIHILHIDSVARGPFRSKLGLPLLEVRYDNVVKGLVEGFTVSIRYRQHTDYVRQIYYYQRLNSIISCSECPKVGLLMKDVSETKESYKYNVERGVWCFSIIDGVQLLASGGSDCLIRLWNLFVPQHPIATLYGHHTAIGNLILQDNGKYLYSLSQDKCIKVWDVAKQSCVQNYLGIPPEVGEHSEMTTLYNPESRQWIIGSVMLAVVPLSPKQSGEHTDGFTHPAGVSVVLYNPLFKLVVSCGLDSTIVVWDPFDGRRMIAIKEAHVKSVHAEIIPIEITAGAFDPGYQRLITGAHDGSLKIWNFNTGTCLRNMKMENNCEIKSIIWVKNRILAAGWNKRVTEFVDSQELIGGTGGEYHKNWDLRHTADISSCVARAPQSLVTATYEGDLIMWRLETGQPYKQFNISDPTSRIKIQYKKSKTKDSSKSSGGLSKRAIIERALGKHVKSKKKQVRHSKESIASFQDSAKSPRPITASSAPVRLSVSHGMRQAAMRGRRVSQVAMPEQCIPLRKLAVHSMLFLQARPMDPQIGTLLVALENGSVQVWSHHISGGFITSFMANHKAGDYVLFMDSDEHNEFLFTGHSVGYIKTWLLKDYCLPDPPPVSLIRLRLEFPFLWGDWFIGRAQRIANNQPKPLLLNSYRGHVMAISGLAYIRDSKILISSSIDYTVRMWSLGGRYLQTLGTFKKWKPLHADPELNKDFEYTIPPDIRSSGSSTTLRVLRGGFPNRTMTFKQMQALEQKEYTPVDPTKIYGTRLSEPILGHYYRPTIRTTKTNEIKFDTTFPYIPVYQHLMMPVFQEVTRAEMKAKLISSEEERETVTKK